MQGFAVLLVLLLSFTGLSCSLLSTSDIPWLKGFNITEDGDYLLELGPEPHTLSMAQKAVLEAKRLGANHVIFNPRAAMLGPFSNEIIPIIPLGKSIPVMRARMVPFLQWVRRQGLTVQLRPILFVVTDLNTLAPFFTMEEGQRKSWFHGNIRPQNPEEWFASFKAYHDLYLTIARLAQVEFYTLGAELYSMTVGIEGEWKEYPEGFPKNWSQLLQYARKQLPAKTKIMYDLTYTDDYGHSVVRGGEFERWRHRLVDLPASSSELREFWSSLDAIGVDMYRSLGSGEELVPQNYPELVKFLRQTSDRYAKELTASLSQIETTLKIKKSVILKEVGFRSSQLSFLNPFAYDNPGEQLNLEHQAAAYEAFLESFSDPKLQWLGGMAFWDIGVSPKRRGEQDNGFTPVGKPHTEAVIKRYYQTIFSR